jgi:F-type H+-transporting ATPase subunit delta
MDRQAERTGAKIMASVANSYARAFADVILDVRLDPGQALTELRSVQAWLAQSGELRRVWENPAIPAEQKRGLLDAIAERDRISSPVRNLVAVLIDHQRVKFFEPIIRQVQKELDARLGFAEADVTSARELGDSEKRALESKVGTLTGKKVRARYQQDTSLLGGVVVRVGSTIYDGSVKGQLEKIREAIRS